jgi:hypothetical protein
MAEMFSFFNANCLKSEKNEKFKKRDYSTSSIHKDSIYKVLFPSSVHREGMTEKEIQTKLDYLSDKTIFNLLNELILEGKVFKRKKKYYLDLFFDDGWSVFARFLSEFLSRQYNVKDMLSRKIYSHGHTFPDELENEIYNFGSIIGAFIIYILIESFRPNEIVIRRSYRDQIWTDFLQNAVHMPYILQRFSELLPGGIDVYRISLGIDNKSFDKVNSAYNNVYPGFSEFLDDRFRKYIGSVKPFEDKSCDHEWHKVTIHKIGERFECRKCLGLIEEKI